MESRGVGVFSATFRPIGARTEFSFSVGTARFSIYLSSSAGKARYSISPPVDDVRELLIYTFSAEADEAEPLVPGGGQASVF